ncbi:MULTISPECIES: helix-turn-helix domain-containing protein [unclassified Aurantimonas]|uniref:helix-turn-helix domain-containing protein n=1 Tax=unclassified Aurantimonas TaxID=2638230 RepID=UPI002E17392F|nr:MULTISPECIES: helix-turn-helix transcriptional regulator [unclassified Aurantimonas]MEC5289424.1 helix-turn-helix transcriptional regulator [Aurantimonas sp. C2-3-R2]MEC5410504.1 helix-turn-helix transcriptional regulator [Aurantimonas sp. C2-4-R8]
MLQLKNMKADAFNGAHGNALYAQTDYPQEDIRALAHFSCACGSAIHFDMDMRTRVQRLIGAEWQGSKITQQRMGERLNVAQSTINRWLKGSEPEGDNRDALLAFYREVFPDEEIDDADMIPIVGRAGAATDGKVAYADGQGHFGHVPRPRGASPNTVALEIHGGSMGYLADGSIVLYSERHPMPLPDMIGQAVIVGLPGDMVLLKRLLRGSEPGLWDLESINGPILPDQRVDWFSHIDFIVPTWRAAQLRLP